MYLGELESEEHMSSSWMGSVWPLQIDILICQNWISDTY